MSSDGKTLGIAGGILAAIGAAFAHGADDCARAGTRVAAHGGDDLARPAIAARGLPNAGDDLSRMADDLAKPPSESALQALGEEASLQALDLMIQEPSDESEPSDVAGVIEPAFVSITPTSPERFQSTFARRPNAQELSVLARLPKDGPEGRAALLERVGSRGPLTLVLGHAHTDAPEQLLTPDGAVSVADLQQKSARAGRSSLILVCESADFDRECTSQALSMIDTVRARRPERERDLVRALLALRARHDGKGPTLHRVIASNGQLRRVHSRKP